MLRARCVKKAVGGVTVSALLSNCGSFSGFKLLCHSVAILGRDAVKNIDDINDCAVRARYLTAVTHCDGR